MTVTYRKVCACEQPLHFDPTFTLEQLMVIPGDPIQVTVTMTQGPTCSKCGARLEARRGERRRGSRDARGDRAVTCWPCRAVGPR